MEKEIKDKRQTINIMNIKSTLEMINKNKIPASMQYDIFVGG